MRVESVPARVFSLPAAARASVAVQRFVFHFSSNGRRILSALPGARQRLAFVRPAFVCAREKDGTDCASSEKSAQHAIWTLRAARAFCDQELEGSKLGKGAFFDLGEAVTAVSTAREFLVAGDLHRGVVLLESDSEVLEIPIQRKSSERFEEAPRAALTCAGWVFCSSFAGGCIPRSPTAGASPFCQGPTLSFPYPSWLAKLSLTETRWVRTCFDGGSRVSFPLFSSALSPTRVPSTGRFPFQELRPVTQWAIFASSFVETLRRRLRRRLQRKVLR